MFTIGDFARLGQVSVRMLRHYDALGLLRPAQVDAASGYRFYDATQLRGLNRLVALKDLGFTLQQVGQILNDEVSGEQLRGMLRLRQSELEQQITADAARLARVSARLRMIDDEDTTHTLEATVKRIEPVRVAVLTGTAAGYESDVIGPVIQGLFPRLAEALTAAGFPLRDAAIAYYTPAEGGEVTVHAAFPVDAEPDESYGFAIVDLPGIPTAATMLHHGPMANIGSSFQALAGWIEDNGYTSGDFARERYLDTSAADQSTWVTELQVAITAT